MILQTVNGYCEAVLMGVCDAALFHKTTEWLCEKIGITFKSKIEQAGSLVWQFQFEGAMMVLRYDPEAGIFICPAAFSQATGDDQAAFKKLAETLYAS
ncbi:hypothetical protein A3860_34575 [Niastella vici]|uniref:DUF3630 family protein n=1 Tax=Niastella vici TaxID=1703345 RepID=A0A1V9FPB2_9BACT|nr:hypothetical protein [Niastella vici]OQP60204.1 hypothetical protein A3860_34575 [Niastella vici]